MFIIRVISLIIIVLISYILHSEQIIMASECTKNGLICSAWNMRGLVTAKPYLRHLMSKSDIIAVSEHMLYDCELWKLGEIDNNFSVTARASRDLDDGKCGKRFGHCGVALFWNMLITSNVKSLDNLGSDRICAIQIMFHTHT